jgi:hypothetical protein
MTREEAIKKLEVLTIMPWNIPELLEALDMAIEALQREQTAEWIQPTTSEDCRRLDIRFVRCSKCREKQIVVGHKGYNELPFN